jgi:soluble lytic murein transglycosylase-like protein
MIAGRMTTRAGGVLFFALLASCAWAAEYAVLDNGSRLRVDGHAPAPDDRWRLDLNGGSIEVPASRVIAFEPEPVSPKQPANPTADAQPAPDPRRVVDAVANKYGLPKAFLHSVVAAESGYNPAAVSPKGAIGLMQLMPGTARELKADPHDVRQNVDAGAQYLTDLLRKYGNNSALALAAYNAGPGAVDRYSGIPPYRETQSYVDRVIRNYLKSNSKK